MSKKREVEKMREKKKKDENDVLFPATYAEALTMAQELNRDVDLLSQFVEEEIANLEKTLEDHKKASTPQQYEILVGGWCIRYACFLKIFLSKYLEYHYGVHCQESFKASKSKNEFMMSVPAPKYPEEWKGKIVPSLRRDKKVEDLLYKNSKRSYSWLEYVFYTRAKTQERMSIKVCEPINKPAMNTDLPIIF